MSTFRWKEQSIRKVLLVSCTYCSICILFVRIPPLLPTQSFLGESSFCGEEGNTTPLKTTAGEATSNRPMNEKRIFH